MITEEQKQEADSVVEKYSPFTTYEYMGDWCDDIKSSINCAIQDRQSVLDALQKAYNIGDVYNATCDYIDDEIQSLNAQITYLKSKL